METENDEKVCKKCNVSKPLTEFPTDNSSKDKKWRFCKSCESARKKEYRLKKKLEASEGQKPVENAKAPKKKIGRPKKSPKDVDSKESIVTISKSLFAKRMARQNVEYYHRLKNRISSRASRKKFSLCGQTNNGNFDIILYWRGIENTARKWNIKPIKKMIGTINHEILHKTLYEIDWAAYDKWDNIATELERQGYL